MAHFLRFKYIKQKILMIKNIHEIVKIYNIHTIKFYKIYHFIPFAEIIINDFVIHYNIDQKTIFFRDFLYYNSKGQKWE